MEVILPVLVWLVVWLVPLAALLFISYSIVSLPLRRRERARAFLTLLEVSLKDGRSPEETIVSLAAARDPGMGARFLELASSLRGGMRLSEGLEKVPRLVPPQVVAMLKAGEKMGDLRKVLPACRQWLKDTLGQTRSPMNYMLVAASLTTPAAVAIVAMLQVFVFPKFQDVMANMDVANSTGAVFFTALRGPLLFVQFLLVLAVWLTAFVYIGGPAFFAWSDGRLLSLEHRLHYALPWRRKRMQRDFSTILALLLDTGVPEAEALTLAAGCAANRVFEGRAEQGLAALKQGVKLTEAVQLLDDTGEFRWRLANAVHAHGGFSTALAGWVESLDARAFQQEQATAQLVTTALVLLNGLFVGTIVVSVFSMLVAVINEGLLW